MAVRLVTGAVGIGVDGGITRTGLDWVAAREIGQVATSLLAEDGLKFTFIGGGGRGNCQEAASGGITAASCVIGVVALVDGVLKGGDVPAVLEISMEGETSWVAGSPYERPSLIFGPLARKVINVPGNFVKELHEVNGVVGGASAIIEAIEKGNVTGVGRGIQVDTVPAGGHVDTSLESGLAGSVGPTSIGKSVVVTSLTGCVVSEASPLNGTLGKFTLTTRVWSIFAGAAGCTATYHLETSGESLKTRSAVGNVAIATVLVVDKKTAVCDLRVSVGLGVSEVQLGEPVVR